MAKAKTTKAKKSGSAAMAFDAKVASIMTSASALLAALKGLGLPVLTDEERLHTVGKLRGGEPAAMLAILGTVDANPALFASLATGGDAVDTAPARDALGEFRALAPLSAVFAQMSSLVSDGMIANGEIARGVTMPAYALGKAIAATNAKVRTSLAPAITFYGGKTRKVVAAKKRVANATKRAAKSAGRAVSASN